MSFTITTDVFCDICNDWTFGIASHRVNKTDAWKRAKSLGWTKVKGKHICPLCNKKAWHRSPEHGYFYETDRPSKKSDR